MCELLHTVSANQTCSSVDRAGPLALNAQRPPITGVPGVRLELRFGGNPAALSGSGRAAARLDSEISGPPHLKVVEGREGPPPGPFHVRRRAFSLGCEGGSAGAASISGECEVVHTSLPIPPSKVAIATCGPLPRGEQMAQERDSLGFRFAVVVALAVIIVATTTWAADHERASAGSIPPSEVIYRAQHLNLF